MRVAMYYSNDDVRVEEAPVPSAGPGELLLRVHASGICGTDVLEWYRRKQAPVVLGHEVAGEVAEVGPGVEAFAPGDRIVATHHVPCQDCRYCRSGHASVCQLMRQTRFDPGGFAEYLKLAKANVDSGAFLLPDSLSFVQGSFVEPLGCVVRAWDHARAPVQETVLVMGAGIAGLLHVQLARSRGVETLAATDLNEERLRLARSLGAHEAIPAGDDVPARLREASGGRLADLVVVCTGAAPAIRQAFQCVERGGTLLFFASAPEGEAVPVPLYEMWRDEVRLVTSYGASPQDMEKAVELLAGGKVLVDRLVTHRLALAETGKGFQLVANARDSLKVVIEPQRT